MQLFGPPNIAKLKAARDVPRLIAALNHKDKAIQKGAIVALGELGDLRALKPLLTLFEARKRWHRDELVEATIPVLGNLALRSGDESWIRLIANEYLSVLLDPERSLSGHAIQRLMPRLAPYVVDPLVALFRDTQRTFEVRSMAVDMLGATRDRRAVTALIDGLNDADWAICGRSAKALGVAGDPLAVEPLVALLRAVPVPDVPGDRHRVDEANSIRGSAAEALGELGDRRAVEPLLDVVQHDAGGVASSAAAALGKLGDGRAVQPLIDIVNERHYPDFEIIRALGQLGDRRAIAPLQHALTSDSEGVRNVSAEALRMLGAPRPPIQVLVVEFIQIVHDIEATPNGSWAWHFGVGPTGTPPKTDPIETAREAIAKKYGLSAAEVEEVVTRYRGS